jgi:acyl carrier protein
MSTQPGLNEAVAGHPVAPASRLLGYVRAQYAGADPAAIGMDTDLFAEAGLDSIGLVGLMLLIEELAGTQIDYQTHDLRGVSTLADLVARFLPGRSVP